MTMNPDGFKDFFEESRINHRNLVREKIYQSGRPTVSSEDQYKALQVLQNQKLAEEEKTKSKPDYSRAGITVDDFSLNWSSVKPNYSDGIKAIEPIKTAFQCGYGMIFVWGNYGQAKTLIGKILTIQAIKAGKRAAYANLAHVLDDIRLAYDEQEHKTTELLRRMDWWNEREILFIDEMDKVNKTEWAAERIFQLIDHRYTRAIRQEALTVIASNSSDQELDGYVVSRLQDNRLGPIIHLDGTDGRQMMPEGWKH